MLAFCESPEPTLPVTRKPGVGVGSGNVVLHVLVFLGLCGLHCWLWTCGAEAPPGTQPACPSHPSLEGSERAFTSVVGRLLGLGNPEGT